MGARYGTLRSRTALCDQCRNPATHRITTTRAGTAADPYGITVTELTCDLHTLARYRALTRARRRAHIEPIGHRDAELELELGEQCALFEATG
jgi:tRNA A37 threonylcarbamoyladenosine dehydratase